MACQRGDVVGVGGDDRVLLRSFGPLLLVGVAVGVAIEAVVSPEAAALLTTGSAGVSIPVRARNSVVAGHAAFRYSLMRPWHRVVLTICIRGGGVPEASSSSAWGGC